MAQTTTTKTQSHSWSFKPVAKKDLNANQWPFKVVRDEGKPSKMECRSLTDLNKSFEGTNYNLNNCPVVKSRYSFLYNILQQKYGKVTSNITHLLITFDSVYFLLKGETEPKKFSYGLNILNNADLNSIVCGYLYKSKYIENRVKESFQRYKNNNEEIYLNQLKKDIDFYINVRKKVGILDNNKYILDILTSDLSFSSLQYLIFMPIPNIAKDYQGSIVDAFMRNNIDCNQLPDVMSELFKVPTLETECQNVMRFISKLKSNGFYPSIRKVFILSPKNEFSEDNIKTLFKNVMRQDYTTGLKYLSSAEKKRLEQEQQRLDKDRLKTEQALRVANAEEEAKKKAISVEKQKIVGLVNQIFDLIYLMTDFSKMSTAIYNKAVEKNSVELDIWGKHYKPETMKSRIDSVYSYYKDNYNKEEELYPIVKIFKELFNNFKINDSSSIETLEYFANNIVPTYFKDDRKATNLDLNTIEGLKNTNKLLNRINKQVMGLYETYLGVQYATFGCFMKRYNKMGLYIAKMLIPNLVNLYKEKPFKITPNVLERANECFYMVCLDNTSLENFNKQDSDLDERYKNFSDFIMYYLDNLSTIKTEKLTHSEANDKDIAQYSNLISVSICIFDILNQCSVLEDLNVKDSFGDMLGKGVFKIKGDE